jgi:ATP-dependent DNA ligase
VKCGFNATAAFPTIGGIPRPCTILAPTLAVRDQVGWFPCAALFRSGRRAVVSRNGNTFKSFRGLCEGLARDLKGRGCVLDGEIVCLDLHGKPQFRDLLFRRAEPMFYAFDLLWDTHTWSDDDQERRRFRNPEDVRYLPLIDRKLRLRSVVSKRGERLLYCNHIEHDGQGLFQLACHNDLEGIVAKRMFDPYLPEHTSWLKIRNQQYSQWIGRQELFERERASNPDARLWDECALACESAKDY